MTTFELWDIRSRNLMGGYETEALALADLAAAISAYGAGYADSVMLLRVGPRGGLTKLAAGSRLASRALKTARAEPGRISA